MYVGFRHWHPYIHDVYVELLDDRPEQLIGLCMAPQYSTMSVGAYIKKVEGARAALGGDFPTSYVQSWHRHPLLYCIRSPLSHQQNRDWTLRRTHRSLVNRETASVLPWLVVTA